METTRVHCLLVVVSTGNSVTSNQNLAKNGDMMRVLGM
jgi:hypothetical protein